jgi:hypothetical protein
MELSTVVVRGKIWARGRWVLLGQLNKDGFWLDTEIANVHFDHYYSEKGILPDILWPIILTMLRFMTAALKNLEW